MRRFYLIALVIGAFVYPFVTLRAGDRPTFESLWQEANAASDHHVVDETRDVRVEVPSKQTIYYFTKPGQPEHPGVVKRSVVQVSNHIDIQTQGWSFGDQMEQVAFDKLLSQFKAQDEAMRQRMGSKP